MPGHKLIPYGELQGCVAVEVDVSTVDLDEEGELTTAVLQARVPNTAAVELVNAPWGTSQLDRALLMLAADGRTEGIQIWACRTVHESRWASHPVWWCLDASALFVGAGGSTAIVNAINALPFLPPPTEVILLGPAPESVSAAALDELYTRLDPGGAWVYLDRGDESWGAVEREVARATTPWGLRDLPAQPEAESGGDDATAD